MKTFRDVIAVFGTPEDMARELRGVITLDAARHCKTRDTIPSKYWPAVIKGAAKKGVTIDGDDLLRIQKRKLNGKRIVA